MSAFDVGQPDSTRSARRGRGDRNPNDYPTDFAGSELDVYAIVRAGGRQEKVAVGDVLIIDKVNDAIGSSISLPALLLVDGDAVTSDAAALANVTVTAEVIKPAKGPKITIMKFKNKTTYRKRQGHRQHLTQVKVTAIEA